MLPHGAFTALLLLLATGASAVTVLPPTNVTISCQAAKVTVSWLHGEQQQPDAVFTVRMQSSAGDYEEETTAAHQLDLSRFVWASEERYLAVHWVTVSASRGGGRSPWVLSDTFSFNPLQTVNLKCSLDFPPVELKLEGSEAVVRLSNPFLFYTELQQADKPEDAHFQFSVSVGNKKKTENCSAMQRKCDVISFPVGEERCFNLSEGGLCDELCSRYVAFRDTGRLCPTADGDYVHVIVFISLLSAVVLVILVAVISVCCTKAWTLGNEIKPVILEPQPESQRLYFDVLEADISPVAVVRPCKRLSVSSGGDGGMEDGGPEDGGPKDGGPEDGGLEDSAVSSSSSSSLDAVWLMPEEYVTGSDSVDDSEKTECVSVSSEEEVEVEMEEEEVEEVEEEEVVEVEEVEEEEEVEVPAYDRPHNLRVDMGDGDWAWGYTKR